MSYKIAIVGCGRPLRTENATGFGMAHRHMAGYRNSGRATLVAVVDINRQNAEAFIAEHNPEAAIFTSVREMMERTLPDIVSVCLWPQMHAQFVKEIASFKPKAIFCEKPMDLHWDACLEMHEVCEANGVFLAINHQRRFNLPLAKAKSLLDEGAIGSIERIEGAWTNLMDAGTHIFDTIFFFNNDVDAEWVIAQIDTRGGRTDFGALQAGHAIVDFRFKNGVRATMQAGKEWEDVGALVRVRGDRGILEILADEPWLRTYTMGEPDWIAHDTGETIHDDKAIYRGIASVIQYLDTWEPCMLRSENALRASEVIFAAHESSRQRARIDLPLPPMRSPLIEMIEAGQVSKPDGGVLFG